MKLLQIILNIPWSTLGLLASIISIPIGFSINHTPKALVVEVKTFAWYERLFKKKRVRGMAIGNIVLLGRNKQDKDLEHELVHVEQAMKSPLIFPLLYFYEQSKNEYKGNKYEVEAYNKSGNEYKS